MTTTLKRDYRNDRATGIWTMPDGTEVETLERPWLDNKVNVSCIPSGVYRFTRDRTGRHQYFKILDVPGRTFIEIHLGSKPEHSNGCILVSPEGMATLMEWFDEDDIEFVLEIE